MIGPFIDCWQIVAGSGFEAKSNWSAFHLMTARYRLHAGIRRNRNLVGVDRFVADEPEVIDAGKLRICFRPTL